MKTLYCGIDAGSSNCHVAMMDDAGRLGVDVEIPTSELQLTALLGSLEKDGEKVCVHLEASELTRWIRGIILNRTDIREVVVSDPKQLSWIGKDPRKNDAVDAFKLAELLRLGHTHPVYYSDDDNMTLLKEQVQHHQSVVSEQTRIKNKIKAFLRTRGIIIKSSLAFSKGSRPRIVKSVDEPVARESLVDLYELLDRIQELCKKAEGRLGRLARSWPIIEYFMEAPGMGLVLSCRFVAYIQTPWRFATKRQLWSFCKLGLIQRSSDGKPLSSPRLDRSGNGALKDLSRKVFEGARRRKDMNAFKRAYCRYLENTQNPLHARLSVQRKVITVLWTMWRNNERYDDRRG